MRALFAVLLTTVTATAAPACGTRDLGVAGVAAVRDDGTLLATDGREVLLAGVEMGPGVRPALIAQAQGRQLRLAADGDGIDRYARVVAFARTVDGSETLQEGLLAAGLARVSVRAGGRACADRLLAIEAQARAARRGLWADPNFAPLRAESGTDFAARRGDFVLVEGTVLSVREVGGTIYVNFGRRWTRDFTLTIPKRLRGAFGAAGRDPKALASRRLRVRGWLERRGGPIIEATAPEQIEFVE
jgi:hypothetical protein